MHRIRGWAREKARRQPVRRANSFRNASNPVANATSTSQSGPGTTQDATSAGALGAGAPSSDDDEYAQKNVFQRFYITLWDILVYSYLNWLLVFVPVGIAAHFVNLSGGVVFAVNAIAIVPLAGLLSHATESVAGRLGDTVGALMNVTFGNAVELIIFIIALVKNEIRIVQASLLGSILANLLLILGMCFLLGGLRFREQIYNSTVTQMSACLLSLSVTSLLLPTAFHASFSNRDTADVKVLQVSRGVSVILLLIYGLYLLFQLNSHSYLYESTPQHIIDQEMVPGPAANYFNGSSSTCDSDSSSASDSDASNHSRTTAKKIKRAVKRAATRRHSTSSSDSRADKGEKSTPLDGTSPATDQPAFMPAGTDTAPADDEAEGGPNDKARKTKKSRKHRKHRHHHYHHHKHRRDTESAGTQQQQQPDNQTEQPLFAPAIPTTAPGDGEARRVDFALASDVEAQTAPKTAPQPRPFSLRALHPTISKTISQTVFSPPPPPTPTTQFARPPMTPRTPVLQNPPHHHRQRGLRRASSFPSLHQELQQSQHLLPGAIPPIVPIVVGSTPRRIAAAAGGPDGPDGGAEDEVDGGDDGKHRQMSRTTAVILLLVSTGLVAICAESMVGAINEVVHERSTVSEAFIGLILLPIVGNAAEHVTAVTVAMKNKMDLAIGVALGSSIQIAIFVTPLVVMLGWVMGKRMSLYFTLFETVSMFVSAFIVNFLVLDGRSNYLEGALLCSAYIIIAVAAFFYPNAEAANLLGGGADDGNATVTITATVSSITATLTTVATAAATGGLSGRASGLFG
ncbi:vacuolar calcium ion transporter [Magnaporthiopsis poae ATCC 64411]|uniref:Vacuolar calcium ion transporter n=1 Tax=Magnaporthiopsis poae (strain ATCC 64411 / 73-15) TaxID=644358 RepID=A0A0C4DU35_MAGP6|nr:vacuolar calcium ion transporter [Magnaporthiopsis poae ATCC 64411]